MKTKETAHPKAGNAAINLHLQYTLSDYKVSSAIIDADAVQNAKFNRGRPCAFTEMIIA